jgi:hypothetical protein
MDHGLVTEMVPTSDTTVGPQSGDESPRLVLPIYSGATAGRLRKSNSVQAPGVCLFG